MILGKTYKVRFYRAIRRVIPYRRGIDGLWYFHEIDDDGKHLTSFESDDFEVLSQKDHENVGKYITVVSKGKTNHNYK